MLAADGLGDVMEAANDCRDLRCRTVRRNAHDTDDRIEHHYVSC